jgi:hypothetical protein
LGNNNNNNTNLFKKKFLEFEEINLNYQKIEKKLKKIEINFDKKKFKKLIDKIDKKKKLKIEKNEIKKKINLLKRYENFYLKIKKFNEFGKIRKLFGDVSFFKYLFNLNKFDNETKLCLNTIIESKIQGKFLK